MRFTYVMVSAAFFFEVFASSLMKSSAALWLRISQTIGSGLGLTAPTAPG